MGKLALFRSEMAFSSIFEYFWAHEFFTSIGLKGVKSEKYEKPSFLRGELSFTWKFATIFRPTRPTFDVDHFWIWDFIPFFAPLTLFRHPFFSKIFPMVFYSLFLSELTSTRTSRNFLAHDFFSIFGPLHPFSGSPFFSIPGFFFSKILPMVFYSLFISRNWHLLGQVGTS